MTGITEVKELPFRASKTSTTFHLYLCILTQQMFIIIRERLSERDSPLFFHLQSEFRYSRCDPMCWTSLDLRFYSADFPNSIWNRESDFLDSPRFIMNELLFAHKLCFAMIKTLRVAWLKLELNCFSTFDATSTMQEKAVNVFSRPDEEFSKVLKYYVIKSEEFRESSWVSLRNLSCWWNKVASLDCSDCWIGQLKEYHETS